MLRGWSREDPPERSVRCARNRRSPGAAILGEMRIYVDMCCLKRPFDDQSQPRIRLESEAVLALLAAESATVDFIRSASLRLENRQNPLIQRAADRSRIRPPDVRRRNVAGTSRHPSG
jgi:hypothetical protein